MQTRFNYITDDALKQAREDIADAKILEEVQKILDADGRISKDQFDSIKEKIES